MYNPIAYTAGYEALHRGLEENAGPLLVSGLRDSAKTLLVEEGSVHWQLFVCPTEQQAKEFHRNLRAMQENCWFYPAKDFLFYQADTQGTLITRQRVEVLRQLSEAESGIVVCTVDALMDKVESREHFRDSVLRIAPGQTMELSALAQRLTELGYQRLPELSAMGEFSIRGGIVDIFPFSAENPIRVEFWDTEVDNLRSFDVLSQRSIETLDSAEIYPAKDRDGGRDVSLLDYFPADSRIYLDEPARLRERGRSVQQEFTESFTARAEQAKCVPEEARGTALRETDPAELLYDADEIMRRLYGGRTLALSSLGNNLESAAEMGIAEGGAGAHTVLELETAAVPSYRNNFELLVKDLRRYQQEKYEILLLSASRTRASRLAQNLRDYQLRAYCPDEGEKEQAENRGAVKVLYGYLSTGFLFPEEKLLLLTEGDMFGNAGEVRKKRKQKRYEGQRIAKLSELSPGDYVVQENHGIGIYRGIERIEADGITKDYIRLEYGDGGSLYLPATKLEGIQKYGSADGRKPKLNRLNGTDWQKTRSRVQHAVREMAKELVALYASRQQAVGHKYGQDTVWQKEFEEMFPYEETADQILAIDDTKADMESHKIMDRLVCGDVGYGKTEVALRAAFKAVQDSKQVAYLVPTTILAQQIYNTFVERMKGFPVNVVQLSRFRTARQLRRSIADIAAGRADVVIGTHRLLSRDVEFRDLGLLIIDEEQRFGVANKEKIKNLKRNVDVLTLTATPIPRTLHMSLVGIRDMSVLEEPPIDRVPIQTYVMEYNDELVREAASRELSRGGQVYYVHNRVGNIAEVSAHVQSLLPEARVVCAHGQMNETELEEIMLRFINGEIDVLVSTTIIETGLDIPNANTMIIGDADRMGLSQLYQLRGRVGRSNRTAYAFLMYRRGKLLSEESEKRLKAIREFTQLGSGIRIAMRDLEIRGAGNVLGAEQHGHMEAVGYDLYCKLLNQAVLTEKGELPETARPSTQVDCDIDAYIPDNYIADESQKLDIYKRISAIQNEEDYMDMQDELLDRFGELPKQVQNLLTIAALKALAHRCCVRELNVGRGEYRIFFSPDADIQAERIPELVSLCRGQLSFSGGQNPLLHFRSVNRREPWSVEKTIEHIESVLKKLERV